MQSASPAAPESKASIADDGARNLRQKERSHRIQIHSAGHFHVSQPKTRSKQGAGLCEQDPKGPAQVWALNGSLDSVAFFFQRRWPVSAHSFTSRPASDNTFVLRARRTI
jgi:hypothetical protein